MTTRVLCFLNVSNKDNLSTDSAYIFYDLLSEEFVKNDIVFSFVAPAPLPNKKVKYIHFDFGSSKYAVRFNFNWDKIEQIIREQTPDVLLINQIELIPNYKALIEHLGLSSIRIIGYAHYIPYFIQNEQIKSDISLNAGGINTSIQLNFLSGLIAADTIFTHSKTSLLALKKLLLTHKQKFHANKFIISPPPKDPVFTFEKTKTHSNKIIYNHRLYEHYGTAFLIDAINALNQIDSFSFEIFDILGNRDSKRKRLDKSVEKYRDELSLIQNVSIRTDGNDRNIYMSAFRGALCCLAPYRKGTPWSMSCVDAMSMGIPCVAPNFDWFKEFMPHQLLFSNKKELISIIEKLNKNIDFWMDMSQQSYDCTKVLTTCNIAQNFILEFKKEVKNV